MRTRGLGGAGAVVAALAIGGCGSREAPAAEAGGVPRYEVDAAWPRALPGNWILGQVAGIAVGPDDHVWLVHRPRSLTEDEAGATLTPPRSICCAPAPPVLELDGEGNLLRSWGGPGEGYDWPANEHGIAVDPDGNVWIGGNGATDQQILKFSPDGEFLLQIGRPGEPANSAATDHVGRAAHMTVDPETNELYVADGYLNKRVVVFDASTGAYKRHWGAYGRAPVDTMLTDPDSADVTGQYNVQSAQFGNPVHCVRLLNDGLVYVCDRSNNRIQVFRKNGEFVREMTLATDTRGSGSAWDLVPADPDHRLLLVADGSNNVVHILERETGQVVGTFGRGGRGAGQFHWVHNIAVDSRGDVYTSEVDTGKRAQKFRRVR